MIKNLGIFEHIVAVLIFDAKVIKEANGKNETIKIDPK